MLTDYAEMPTDLPTLPRGIHAAFVDLEGWIAGMAVSAYYKGMLHASAARLEAEVRGVLQGTSALIQALVTEEEP